MARFRILPYKQGSKSAKALSEELGGKVLKLQGSKFKCKYSDIVVNWGNTDCSDIVDKITYHLEYPDNVRMLNWMPHLLKRATNKLKFFELIKENHPEIIPKFWSHKHEIPDDAYPIVCRTVLAGHSGAGIVIANDSSELVNAPLYVKYIKKKDEYRVHLGRSSNPNESKVIALQRKAVPTGYTAKSWQVRNLANGFIFVRNNVNPPASVVSVAKKAFQETELDFGAVDVIWNEQKEKAYVLEINTAPGLEGQTIKDYGDFFRSIINA